jgi:low temperature requirement protein LtrA
MFGGAVLYLVALSALRRRNIGGWNVQRLVAAAVLLLLLPVGAELPALAALAVLFAVLAGLIGYEAVVLATERDRVRHAGPH